MCCLCRDAQPLLRDKWAEPQSTRGGQTLSSGHRNIFKGKVLTLNIERAELPGGAVRELEVARHPGGAAIVAADGEGRVCLIRQYRHAAGGWIWEIPAGKLDVAGETPKACALRELEEEAGVRANDARALGTILSSPGFTDEVIHLYYTDDIEKGEAARSEGEVIEVHWVAAGQALDMARRGDISDAKTVAALFRAVPLFKTSCACSK